MVAHAAQDLDYVIDKSAVEHGSAEIDMTKVTWTVVHFRAITSICALASLTPVVEGERAHTRVVHTSVRRGALLETIAFVDACSYEFTILSCFLSD